ncbi:MAG: hypothetical protein OXE78_04550 [Gammaproteobacteria bacterium]|nr:hypothetical protein [Gammaproteobacteria bacterium]MCY4358004.1 hypothetical protein [Gammaproteobacteria bacterium]
MNVLTKNSVLDPLPNIAPLNLTNGAITFNAKQNYSTTKICQR